VFIKTLLTGLVTVSGLWLTGRILLPFLAKLNISRAERAALEIGLGAALVSNVLLAMGAVGLYRPAPVILALAVLSASGVVVSLRTRSEQEPTERPSKKWTILELSLGLVAAFGVLRAFLIALGPEFQPDALMYHLYLPVLYLSRGSAAFDPHHFTSGYGLLPELVFGVPAALGEVEGARLVHWFLFVASLSFVYGWIKSAWNRASALFAVALLSTPHMMGWCAHTANTEYFMTLYLLASVRLLLLNDPRAALIAGLCAGFAWASKPLAVGFAMVGFLSYAAFQLKDFKTLVKIGAIFGLGVIAAYLPWSVRSLLGTGNPMYPFLYNTFGGSSELASTLKDVESSMKGSGVPKRPIAFILLPLIFLIRPMRFVGLDPGFGWLFGYAALLAAPRFSGRGVLRLFALGCAVIFFISSQQLRFLMPMYFALAIMAAGTFSKVSRRALVGFVLLAFPIMNIVPIAKYLGNHWYLDYDFAGHYLTGRESREEFLVRKSYGGAYQVSAFMNIIDPDRSERVISFGSSDHLYFWPREIVSFPASPHATSIERLIVEGDLDGALEQIEGDGFELILSNNVFNKLLRPLIDEGKILPVFQTDVLFILRTGAKSLADIPYPDGVFPLMGFREGRPKYYAWMKHEGWLAVKQVKRLKLKVLVPAYVLEEGPQVIDVQLDSRPFQTLAFDESGTNEFPLADLDACDGRPHKLVLKASNVYDVGRLAGFLDVFHSIAITDMEVELCDGAAFEPQKKYWPISGIKDWRERIAPD